MLDVENPPVGVVEATEEKREAVGDEGDVGRGHHHQRRLRSRSERATAIAHVEQQALGILQLLEDVEEQHHIVLEGIERKRPGQVGLLESVHRAGQRLAAVDPGDPDPHLPAAPGDRTAPASDVEQIPGRRLAHHLERQHVCRIGVVLVVA